MFKAEAFYGVSFTFYARGREPAARLSFKCGPRVHTAHVMLGLPYVLLFNISAY